MAVCEAHAAFEKLMASEVKNLAEKITDGIETMTTQSAANGESLRILLENQADRRELCGRQNARIDTLVTNDRDQWSAINGLRKIVWMGLGGLAVLEVALRIFFK